MSAAQKVHDKLMKRLQAQHDRQMEVEEEAKAAISLAKSRIMKKSPFFANLLFRMPVIINYDIPTMATDGLVLIHNPLFTTALKRKDLIFVLLHEIQHVFFKHPMRCPVNFKDFETFTRMFQTDEIQDPFMKQQLDQMKAVLGKWNIACDHVVNLNCRDNMKIPPTEHLVKNIGIQMDDKFKGKTSEEVFKQLPDIEDPDFDQEQGFGAILPVGMGEMDDLEKKDAEKELDQNVQAAVVAARKAGNLPGGVEKVIEDLYTTKTPWQDIMRTQISAVVSKMDYTFQRPNRRFAQHQANHGVILPGLWGEEFADMYFIMDTSGSVSEQDRVILVSELKQILEDYGVRIHLIYCDTKVQGDPIVLTREDIRNGKLQIELKGYGGTDFRPAFQYVNEHLDEIHPEMVVYLTDMYPNTWNLGPEPPYSVFWAVLPQGTKSATPPWGVQIHIELED